MSGGSLLGPADFTDCSIPLQGLEQPGPGEVHVWHLDLGLLGRSLGQALETPGEAAPAQALTLGQLRFARHFYLRLLLGGYLGIPGKSVSINRSERGKPVLDRTVHVEGLHFSIAKSDDRTLVGISTSGLVGVDLEPANRRARNPLALAGRYFSGSEAEALRSMSEDRIDHAFLRAWACKEAVVKASGQGIANQLCRFTVEMDPERAPSILEFENEDSRLWSLAVVQPEASYLGAVASHFEEMTISPFRLLPHAGKAD